MKLVDILRTLQMVGSDSAAYIDLFNRVAAQFGPQEQQVLQRGLAEAQAKSDALHEQVQAELKTAAKK